MNPPFNLPPPPPTSRLRCWAEIDLARLRGNLDALRARLAPGTAPMAVVKADAYGHGDRQLAPYLQSLGVSDFAVSNVDEARHLREAGVTGRILLLGYTPAALAPDILALDVTQTLLSEEFADEWAATALPVRCQYAIDTGMRRIGLDAADPDRAERAIRRAAASSLRLDGLFTHLCVADTPAQNAFTRRQIALFDALADRVADLRLPCLHCLNSAGALWHSARHSALARLGIVLYGLKPDAANTLPPGIRPPLSWKTVMSMVKTVAPGKTVGYGRTYAPTRPATIATLPAGYADGYPRHLSGIAHVLVNGRRAPLVGRICMDQMMADVTGIPGVRPGTEVVLVGDSGTETITADDLASLSGTIGYEIVCAIGKRVPRYYV